MALVALREETREGCVPFPSRPREHTAKGWPSTSQEEGPHRNPPDRPRPWTSSPQKGE